MRVVIDPCDDLALKMVAQILDRPDGVYEFSGGFRVEVRTTKTQKLFKVVSNLADN